MEGVKHDGGKDRWDLLPWEEVRSVVRVLTMGAEKYADDNWKHVPNPRNRYFAAGQRHIGAWWTGERWDQESGCHHLAHAICCLLFAMWHDCNEAKQSGGVEHPAGDATVRFCLSCDHLHSATDRCPRCGGP